MSLDEKITEIRTLISQRDEIDRQIAALLGDAALSVRPVKKKQGPRGPNKTEKDLAAEADQRHGRSRIDLSTAADIEDRLVAGESVSEIVDQVDVSAPTVYVMKARLKQEGRII